MEREGTHGVGSKVSPNVWWNVRERKQSYNIRRENKCLCPNTRRGCMEREGTHAISRVHAAQAPDVTDGT